MIYNTRHIFSLELIWNTNVDSFSVYIFRMKIVIMPGSISDVMTNPLTDSMLQPRNTGGEMIHCYC